MKNITHVNKLQQCWDCKSKGFFSYTHNGATYITCPCCHENDFMRADDLSDNDFNNMRNLYNFCSSCKIIFDLGCMHSNGGCAYNAYNCHFIKKWKDKTTNVEYEGMPLFDDTDDWFNNVNNIEVLELHCAHNGAICSKSHHKVDTVCKLKVV